eukprot:4374634-Lingulodinium_polyedra.AAC.1
MDDARTLTLILCYCRAPGEHLLQVFQQDDSAGGSLRSTIGECCEAPQKRRACVSPSFATVGFLVVLGGH